RRHGDPRTAPRSAVAVSITVAFADAVVVAATGAYPGGRSRPVGRGRTAMAGLGDQPAPALGGPGAGPAQPDDPTGAVLPADRRGDRGRDLVAAGGDRWPAELGLPVLLAARCCHERTSVGTTGFWRRGRGVPVLDPAHHPGHRRTSGTAAPTVHS